MNSSAASALSTPSIDDAALFGALPAGSSRVRIAFAPSSAADRRPLVALPRVVGRQAVEARPDEPADLTFVGVPANSAEALDPTPDELARLDLLRRWVDESPAAERSPTQLLTFQGARLLWTPGRCAVLAPADRLEALRDALVEASFYEAELRAVERETADAWGAWEADLPLAFEFDAESLDKVPALRRRHRQTLQWRARLVRIGPHVDCPPLHPPTLAGQIGERLRERTRMVHRYEYLDDQLEVFESVYEGVSQRSSDFRIARTGHALEWVIVVLLVLQLLLSAFELLPATSDPANPSPANPSPAVSESRS